jgi:hypothetical protein
MDQQPRHCTLDDSFRRGSNRIRRAELMSHVWDEEDDVVGPLPEQFVHVRRAGWGAQHTQSLTCSKPSIRTSATNGSYGISSRDKRPYM